MLFKLAVCDTLQKGSADVLNRINSEFNILFLELVLLLFNSYRIKLHKTVNMPDYYSPASALATQLKLPSST